MVTKVIAMSPLFIDLIILGSRYNAFIGLSFAGRIYDYEVGKK